MKSNGKNIFKIDECVLIHKYKKKWIIWVVKKITKRKSYELPEGNKDNNAIPKNIIPSFNTIKPSIYRLINKNIPKYIEEISELQDDSPYYYKERGDKFMAHKSEKIVLLISKF